MHEYDKSSKWLIQHHGDSILRLAGVRDIRAWRPLQAELVQPRQLPDGLLEVELADRQGEDLFLLEIATYPEKRVHEQALRDLIMVLMARGILPEMVVLVLSPKGKRQIKSEKELRSRLGLAGLRATWRVVELWTVPAQELLSGQEVGLVPLVPLAAFEGQPEPLLRRCRQIIEERAKPEEQANLLAITQVLTYLRYKDRSLSELLGGTQAMIESPLIQEIEAKRTQRDILKVLKTRFKKVPEDIVAGLGKVLEEKDLDDLLGVAAICKGLAEFRRRWQATLGD
jgi:hypothetical protein